MPGAARFHAEPSVQEGDASPGLPLAARRLAGGCDVTAPGGSRWSKEQVPTLNGTLRQGRVRFPAPERHRAAGSSKPPGAGKEVPGAVPHPRPTTDIFLGVQPKRPLAGVTLKGFHDGRVPAGSQAGKESSQPFRLASKAPGAAWAKTLGRARWRDRSIPAGEGRSPAHAPAGRDDESDGRRRVRCRSAPGTGDPPGWPARREDQRRPGARVTDAGRRWRCTRSPAVRRAGA